MEVSLILLAVLFGAGLLLYLHHRLTGGDPMEEAPSALAPVDDTADNAEGECCGMHITCEKDSLLATVSTEVEYYDDEELDQYAGRTPEEYDEKEIEEFRDVLLTLLPDDIAGWGRSLQLRGIALPQEVKEELLMIVAEERSNR